MKCELYHDNFQNFKRYNVPKAQLVIADIPYNIGADAYASNPMWYKDGDNKNGESKLAKQSFFHTDGNFRIAEYMHFCNRMLRKEPKEKGQAPAMIVFCAFEQMQTVICAVCEGHYVTRAVLARLLDRSPDALRQTHISPMVRSGMLELAFPSKPTHEQQAYKTGKL